MQKVTATDVTDDLTEALAEEQVSGGALSASQIEEIKKKSVGGVVSYFLRSVFLQGIGLVSALLLTAFLAPEDFGVYGIVVQIIALLTFFSDVGLAAALIQSKTKPSSTDYRTAFTTQQILAWVIFFLVVWLSRLDWLATKLGSDGILLLLALALSFPLATLKTISSIQLERKLEFNKLVIPQIFEQLVFNFLLIVLAWQGRGVLSYAYAIVARSVVGVIVMQLIKPWLPGLSLNRESLRKLLSFGLKFQLNDFLARIKDQLYFLVLGAFLPLQQFGYLQWAKNWSMYPYNLTVQNVMAITFPTFSRLQTQRDLLKRAIEKSIYFIALFIFPILAGMSIFIYPLTELIPQYQKWQPALPSFVLFALSVAWAAISTPLVNTLNAIGQINQTLKLMVMWTVLTWVLTPLLLWKFAFTGVALAAFLISFTSLFSVWMVKKYIAVNIFAQVKVQLLATLVMTVLSLLLLPQLSANLLQLLLTMFIAAASYTLVLLLLARPRLIMEIKSLRRG